MFHPRYHDSTKTGKEFVMIGGSLTLTQFVEEAGVVAPWFLLQSLQLVLFSAWNTGFLQL